MRRRTAVPIAVALLLGAAACQKGDDTAAKVDAGAPSVDLASAVSAAQADMPIPVSNSRVGVLLQDLCDGGSGVADQLGALTVTDAAQADAVLDALSAGTHVLCPGGVDPGAAAQARAEAMATSPSSTVADVSADASNGGGNAAVGTAGRTHASTSSAASGGASSTAGAASNQSTGTAQVGGGSASGSGNQSSTSYSQSVGGGSSSNQASG
jgi:hypothetical protein